MVMVMTQFGIVCAFQHFNCNDQTITLINSIKSSSDIRNSFFYSTVTMQSAVDGKKYFERKLACFNALFSDRHWLAFNNQCQIIPNSEPNIWFSFVFVFPYFQFFFNLCIKSKCNLFIAIVVQSTPLFLRTISIKNNWFC